ncbi:pre-mRNA cleavage factor [Loa loa]|uniref:Cleavage and polyadenylation specificity factor subunit 5 n=1 Tax=Loa loa TaxID=7209 RepID=A0A1I7VDE0_LOALO|nr:pre-mRNA cleavage factor [Loa loa]EFO24419.1 pre-mRNA cleavage factor [Loa loa]
MTTVTLPGSSTASSVGESQLCSCKRERRSMSSVIRLYPLTNYSVRSNDYEDPPRIFDYKQSLKLRQEYENDGMVRTVQGVLLGHQNSIIHVLLLKNGVGQMQSSKLPEVTLYHGEDEIAGMKRLMAEVLGFEDAVDAVCQIQHIAAKWWRPNFEAPIYPYIPSHITKPKEMIRVFVVELPKKATFTIAKNNTLVAAPVFEIYDNVNGYGPIIASLPHVLGRFNYLYYP